MDDLYNNAWGESVQVDEQDAPTTKATATLSSLSLKPSWLRTVSPSIGPSHTVEDSEADLAAPSWSTGADIRWNEPSEDSHGFGWSHTEPDMAWGTSTYDSIHIGKSAAKETKIITEDGLEAATLSPTSTLTASEPEEELPQDTSQPSVDSPIGDPGEPSPSTPCPAEPESPPRIPVPIPIPSRSSSPDGFGGFSSGFETSDDTAPYKAGVVGDIEEDTWGSAWNNAAEEKSDDEAEVEDEWTAARRRKENFDRRIPSGYVDDIKEHCEQLFKSLTAKVDPKQIDDDKDSFRNNLRATLDDLDDLTVIRHQYLPDLTLQPPLNFPKTATYKGMSNALRLTRNLPMVKDSPMSHYMASKGSTAWETAVRGQKDVVEEDVVPLGWRILEKEAPKPVVAAQKSTGRLFSFWGKKDSKPFTPSAPAAASGHTATPSTSNGASPVEAIDRSSLDKRNSAESVRSVSSTRPVEVSTLPSATLTTSATSSAPVAASSYADAPMVELDGTEIAPTAAPSAVSRFLGRFSRRQSSVSSTSSSPRQSLALSSGDFEYLSDVMPSVSNDGEDDHKALSAMLPSNSLPPLLAPPPASTPTIRSAPTTLVLPRSGNSMTIPPPAQSSQATLNGFDSFFDVMTSPASSSVSGTFPLLSAEPSPTLSSPSVALTSRPQSPISLLQSQMKPVTPSPISVSTSAQPFGLPPPASRSHTPVLSSVKQPFTFPPPPSSQSSRSQTPISMSPPIRPHSSLSQTNRSSTFSTSRMRPPNIGVLPPPSSSSSPVSPSSSPTSSLPADGLQPTTPTSSVPLALLYPNAVSPPSKLGLVPTPVSRGHTPLPPPPASTSRTLLPPPRSTFTSSQASHAVASLDDDDDDFADFQSSAHKPMPLTLDSGFLSPELQSPTSATNVPMLGGAQASGSRSFGQSLAAQKASATAFFQSAAAAVGKTQPVTFDSFDDEFSAFTSPVESSNSANFDTSGSSLLSASGSGFDGFSSFAASPGLRTPSPPKLPAKITSTFRPPPPPAIMSKPPPAPVPVTKLRPPSPAAAVKPKLSIAPPPPARETHHQHTLSLMDLANSRKGKHWPAPPSPLPQALFPPPNAAAASGGSSGFDFLADDEESFGSFNSTAPPAAEGLLASNSSPAAFGHQPLLPSSSTTSSNGLRPGMLHSQSVSSAGSGKWLMGSQSGSSVGMSMSSGAGSLQSVPAAVPPGKKGPLTAQDLSFFEGL